MLKKFQLIIITILIVSCGKEQNGYTINTSIDNVKDSTKVFLNTIKDRKLVPIDTTIVLNNTFTFSGENRPKDIYFITLDGLRSSVALVLENETINVTAYKDSLHNSIVAGTRENELLQEYTQAANLHRKAVQKFRLDFTKARQTNDSVVMNASKSSYDSIMKAVSENDTKFINNHPEALMSVFILERILNNKSQTLEEIKLLFDKLPETSKESRTGKNISETLERNLATAEGSVAPNFSAPTPDGKTLALNDVKGKVTIIDFWAAWCGPCRKENPNLVKVYNQYHDKGLEIIGVSLDGNPRQQNPKEAWIKAIEDDGLTWHQVSNLKYFNDEIAKQYNISSIPATFILDDQGKIVAKNLRGQALESKIAELLN